MNIDKLVNEYLGNTAERQMTADEIRFLISNILFPCRLLVFGMGMDSKMWYDLNFGGQTTFVEDSEEWILKAKGRMGNRKPNIIQTEYWTDRDKYKDYLGDPNLLMDIGDNYNTIFVDGPFGKPHGRCQSIATAAHIHEKTGAKVFIHDCHRGLEIAYCDHYFPKIYTGVHHLRMYE